MYRDVTDIGAETTWKGFHKIGYRRLQILIYTSIAIANRYENLSAPKIIQWSTYA